MRDDPAFTILDALSSDARLGLTIGDAVMTSPIYIVVRRGAVPRPQSVPQKRGGVKYLIESPDDGVRLLCGGLHTESGALIAGELQLPLVATANAKELFRLFSRELFRGFTRVRMYWVGPEALERRRAGQRLVTIGLGSAREYDLSEPSTGPRTKTGPL